MTEFIPDPAFNIQPVLGAEPLEAAKQTEQVKRESPSPAQEAVQASEERQSAGQATLQREKPAPRFWTRNEMRKKPVASFLVADLIPKGSTGQIVGRSGDCKSFGAQTLASRISEGRDFCGRKTKQCPCFYFNLEGGSFLPKRILADDRWRKEAGWPDHSGELYFWTDPFSLMSDTDIKNAVDFITSHTQKSAFIVIDTQAQATTGVKESAFEEMTVVLDRARKFAKAVNGTVCLIHHMGKDTSRGGRGSSTQRADVDFLIEVERKEDVIIWHTDKEREAADNQSIRFKLKVYQQLVQDEDGDWQSSCVAVPETDLTDEERSTLQTSSAAQASEKKLKGSIVFALKVFNDTIREYGQKGFLPVAKYREAFMERYEPASSDPKKAASSAKTAYHRAVEDLQNRGLIRKIGDRLKNLQP